MASDQNLTFGPKGSQWHYARETKTFDLTRSALTSDPALDSDSTGQEKQRLTIKTTHGPPATAIQIDPVRTALVIVDMQNFFLDKKCIDHPTGVAAVEPLLRTIEKCRKLGIEVVWLNWGLTEADLAKLPAAVLRGFANSLIARHQEPVRNGLGADLGEEMGRTLCAGAWNSAVWPKLATAAVEATDVYCAKNRMSGLWTPEQPLWKHLSEARKTTLLFGGVNTDECVQGTLVDAYNAGWDCVLLDDCCGTTTPDGHKVTVYNVELYYGFVTDSKSFVAGTLS